MKKNWTDKLVITSIAAVAFAFTGCGKSDGSIITTPQVSSGNICSIYGECSGTGVGTVNPAGFAAGGFCPGSTITDPNGGGQDCKIQFTLESAIGGETLSLYRISANVVVGSGSPSSPQPGVALGGVDFWDSPVPLGSYYGFAINTSEGAISSNGIQQYDSVTLSANGAWSDNSTDHGSSYYSCGGDHSFSSVAEGGSIQVSDGDGDIFFSSGVFSGSPVVAQSSGSLVIQLVNAPSGVNANPYGCMNISGMSGTLTRCYNSAGTIVSCI